MVPEKAYRQLLLKKNTRGDGRSYVHRQIAIESEYTLIGLSKILYNLLCVDCAFKQTPFTVASCNEC